MAGSEPANLMRFFLHYPQGHRLYVCVADHERRPFDFSDNTFKPLGQLSSIENACVYAEARLEDRADHGCSYSVEIELARLLVADDRTKRSTGGPEVTVHWFIQAGDTPNIKTDQQCEHCHLRLIDGKFEPVDNSSREQLDETITFERRARFAEEYRTFVLREIDSQDERRARLLKAVNSGDVSSTLRIVAEDLCYWAGNLKQHLLHQITHLAKDPFFVRMRDTPPDFPLQMSETWIVRDWIGAREAFDLLEFHKSPEYARSYSSRLDRLHEARVEFGKLVTRYTVEQRGEDVEGVIALDEMRKDLKHMALCHAEHLDLIATQFDAATDKPADPIATEVIVAPSAISESAVLSGHQQPHQFSGGVMTFFSDRVELSGVDICSGPRSQTRRQILDLLRLKRSDGTFLSYSGDTLATAVDPNLSQHTIAGAVRDLRNDIMEALRNEANIICGRKEVILSGGTGYRLADCVTVHLEDVADIPAITDITDITDTGESGDVPNDDVRDVFDVRDDAAGARRAWILQELAKERRLKAPDIEERFGCSLKTAQRDLTALKDEGKVEFVGAPRTGFYRIRHSPEAS